MKKILIIEDNAAMQKALKIDLMGFDIEIIEALTIEDAKRLFLEHRETLDLIVLDAAVPGSSLNTLPLLHEMRKSFDGPILAFSNDPESNGELVQNGCSDSVNEKSTAHVRIKKILEL